MLKRRYADRSEWARVKARDYTQSYFDDDYFKGYVTLLKINQVSEPLKVSYGVHEICVVDNGYLWLQHFPEGQHFTVTTMFNAKGEVVQWYIDLSLWNGIENIIPYYDDLFLDIVVLPNGQVFLLDEDELQQAFNKGIVNKEIFNLAYNEANRILQLVELNQLEVLKLYKNHKDLLMSKL
ncbi:DUF402 domain-containing protein [Alkalibacillus haloalkaliphilus]|uniref:DUF402 domain-containing protein n=1 Tax=Alkalibacillus haloalkaliphilus TaxID=94136 RepID=A0A511W4W9_9BACI|nr:DUF402 domain-containing protein [Alkalibacillus haloalkaliphilus]GEN46125.1 hypothetical protein AHA02nite_19010 [Alkalibacillus haloalkaliphilus]